MSSRIRMLEDDDTESEQDNNLNPRSNSGQQQQQQQQRMVSMTREELQVLLTRTVDRRVGELLKQNIVPMMSMIVKEEIEKAQEKYFASFRQNFPSGSSSAEPRSLQLQFLNNPSLPIFSGCLIKAEGQTPLEVAIVDFSTKQVVKSGLESSLKVEIIAVEGHFDGNGSCSWSLEGLSSYIVKQKDGTKSLLQGKVHLALKEGIGFVGDISFRHDQNWIRKCELKLVAIAREKLHGITVKGAMTEPFEVKDKRNTYNSKCGPPRLGDPVGRLQNIGKALSGCLIQEKVETVKDFLTQLSLNPQRLREILRNMFPEKWDTTVKHARTCELDSGMSLYTRISPDQKKTGVVFNVVAEVVGIYSESGFKTSDNLSEKEKAEAQKMVVDAYEHKEEWKNFDEITSQLMFSDEHYSVYSLHTDNSRTDNRKCGPPRLGDPVGRLQKIGKALSGCLIQEKIVTVKDFLTQLSLNPQRLREILGKMSPEKWDATVNHARTCELDTRMWLYTRISPDQKKTGVVFNVVAEVVRIYSESGFKTSDNLSEKEKAEAQKMVVAAYEHTEELKYFDEITLLHAYWESVNATSASGSPITPSPLVPYIEASTPSGSCHSWSFPEPSPSVELMVNEFLGFGDVDVYQNSEENMQRLLARAAAAQKRWRMVFGALKWVLRRKTAGVSNVVSSEGMQVPKRLRIY